MKMKILLFDLDGTILDTLGDLSAAMNTMLRRRGYPERTPDEVKNALGYGAKYLVETLLPQGIDRDEAALALQEYKNEYLENIIRHRKFPCSGISLGRLDNVLTPGSSLQLMVDVDYPK